MAVLSDVLAMVFLLVILLLALALVLILFIRLLPVLIIVAILLLLIWFIFYRNRSWRLSLLNAPLLSKYPRWRQKLKGKSGQEAHCGRCPLQQWLRHKEIRLLLNNARIVNGALRKFCEQMGDVLQWDQSNKNYILIHGILVVDWRFYKSPRPGPLFWYLHEVLGRCRIFPCGWLIMRKDAARGRPYPSLRRQFTWGSMTTGFISNPELLIK
jgi:hypothetical protein